MPSDVQGGERDRTHAHVRSVTQAEQQRYQESYYGECLGIVANVHNHEGGHWPTDELHDTRAWWPWNKLAGDAILTKLQEAHNV